MSDISSSADLFFEVETPLGFRVRTTISYWQLITTVKHPAIQGREQDVQQTLMAPDEVRVSKSDASVFLFYRADGPRRWVCAVSKRENDEGFLITAYRTSGIKEGTTIWRK